MHILSVIFYNRPCNYCESSLVTLLHIDHFNIIFKSLRHFSQGCFLCCYPSLRDINTTHSTWLDTSILMSEPPDVRGNKSSRFHLKISKFSSSASSPLVRGNISTISGNPREMGLFQESGKPIVSTLICSASAWDFIASTLIPSMTEFVFFPASTWTRIITTYLFRPVCSFLNHKWYFAIIHK